MIRERFNVQSDPTKADRKKGWGDRSLVKFYITILQSLLYWIYIFPCGKGRYEEPTPIVGSI